MTKSAAARSAAGKNGFFVSQPIVTAGKLGKNRKIFGEEIRLAEVEAQEQKMRVENAVRIAFNRVLTAQEMSEPVVPF